MPSHKLERAREAAQATRSEEETLPVHQSATQPKGQEGGRSEDMPSVGGHISVGADSASITNTAYAGGSPNTATVTIPEPDR